MEMKEALKLMTDYRHRLECEELPETSLKRLRVDF